MQILLETSSCDRDNKNDLFFDRPLSIISCRKLSDVKRSFTKLDSTLKKGFYLAGFISYEAGYAFEDRFNTNKTFDFPLVHFGAYKSPLPGQDSSSLSHSHPSPLGKGIRKKCFTVTKQEYVKNIDRIKAHLTAGDCYQANYTFKAKFDYPGDHYCLYRRLAKSQPTPYSAFLRTADFSILSLSPELFFRKEGNKLTVKPMKGTIAPGKGNRNFLLHDPKNRSENLMIVDLLRNDLGRIARPGSVKALKLFEVEKHKTLYQMTSSLQAEIDPKIGLFSLFSNLFPSGSVTGAPKISSMEIIREVETEERKIYTGAIGLITPRRDMLFNVAIRTLLLTGRRGEMGIGSGITYGSRPQAEFDECLLKSKFVIDLCEE